MADPEVRITTDAPPPTEGVVDVEMSGGTVVEDTAANGGIEEGKEGAEEGGQGPRRTPFIDYLKSPIVKLSVGGGSGTTELTAHKALLEQSPHFKALFEDGIGDSENLAYDFPNDDVEAMGCFLEWLYTGDYFPRRIRGGKELEHDPSLAAIDDTGEQILKHAKLYTLADKLAVEELKHLAHSKIHRVESTAKGEIAYARYVYSKTPSDDWTLKKPIVAFWAQKSHILRHEAEADFKSMCLEFPQFGFDVLSLVLDAKEKAREKEQPGERSVRKRPRVSTLGSVS
ncbi:MAG: hypothetical protein M1833_006070 [Piccolia ochrophora]|nr:MAG: hypothetical protein M1833_006070 [Piccolia ochrophora]